MTFYLELRIDILLLSTAGGRKTTGMVIKASWQLAG